MKIVFILVLFISAISFAENIPVQVNCQAGNGFVKSASTSIGSPYFYDKKTLLVVGSAPSPRTYIIQNQNFDRYAGVAHMFGIAHPNGSSDAFDLMINFSTGKGTFKHGNQSVPLTNCRALPW